MKVVLLKDVPSLGKSGDVKEVAEGFFRNFLAQRGLASAATDAAMRDLAESKAIESRREARVEKANESLAQRITKTQLTMHVKVGEQHRLYGSITGQDIAEALSRQLKQEIDKHRVELEEPIRHLGTYEVTVRLAHGIAPKVSVVVEPEAATA
jgi:large subunit ribosomal protein L9